MGFDAYAPEGIDDIKGATQIEIKFNIDRLPTSILWNQIRKIEASISNKEEFENLLIISPTTVSERTKDRISNRLYEYNFQFKVYFWDRENINKIVAKHRKEANEIANNLFSLRIESAVVQDSKDWKKEEKKRLIYLDGYIKRVSSHFFLVLVFQAVQECRLEHLIKLTFRNLFD